jgi:hypothetical protein
MAKIAILGLGPSLKEFDPLEFDLSIGVNDIWRAVKTDIVVCLDPEKNFTPDRLKVINDCKPQAFYSQIVNWDFRPDFKKINILAGYPDRYCNLDLSGFNKSYCSPFVACQIAWKYHGATEIHLFGVDMINHPHLDHSLCEKIKVHFRHLKVALEQKGCQLIVHGEGILKSI